MKIKFFAGVWDSWGFGINYCPYIKALTFEFIHFYFVIEVWTKKEVAIAKHTNSLIERILEAEEAPKKIAKKATVKKAPAKKKK
jgi:hypothetical protein